MKNFVSVILPFHNAEATLSRAIQSILDQTFTDFELILVDNNSTDNSHAIAEEALKDERVRLVVERHSGVVNAANRGLKETSGDYIARMDADDWSFPDRLSKQVELLERDSTIGLVSGIVEYVSDDPTNGFLNYIDWINGLTDTEAIRLNQFVEYPVVNPSILLRRELYDQFGGYLEGNFPEDYEYFLRLLKNGVHMAKVASPVIKWYDLPGRLTRTHDNYSEEAFNRVRSMYLFDWLEIHNQHHPDIWIWGAGKKSRQRSGRLALLGVEICGFIDVNSQEHSGELPVIHFSELPSKPDRFIVSCVANWGVRKEIRNFLIEKGWKEGMDFVLGA